MTRRKLGQLEAETLAVLAGQDRPVTIPVLLGGLVGPPARTTVHTVLARLIDKGMVKRTLQGRRYVYELTVDESELAAERMFSPLRSANDPTLVLSQFARGLDSDESEMLRRILRDSPESS